MRFRAILISLFLFPVFLFPQNTPPQNYMLLGTAKGIYSWDGKGSPQVLWTKTDVRKIVKVPYGYFFLTSLGILYSKDLSTFEFRNEGFHAQVLKLYKNGQKSFTNIFKPLSDLKVDPENPMNLVTSSKDGVYYSTDGGMKWSFVDNISWYTGIQSAAIFSDPDLKIVMAHPFKGVYLKNITKKGKWENISSGLHGYFIGYEEVSDFVVVRNGKDIEIVASQNFFPAIFKMKLKTKKWEGIYYPVDTANDEIDAIDGLFMKDGDLYFNMTKGIKKLPIYPEAKPAEVSQVFELNFHTKLENELQCRIEAILWVENGTVKYNMSELWMYSQFNKKKYFDKAKGKKGIYLPSFFARSSSKMDEIMSIMKKTGLNTIAIDMKDDFGILRFTPTDPLLKEIGKSSNPVDLATWIPKMKKAGMYLIARIVVFKDQVLFKYDGYKYAVKTKNLKSPWIGYEIDGKTKKTNQTMEYWVDPYCEKVWEYNVAIANDLIKQGFDEIQFDYIRFPTDGYNIYQATFGYKEHGMDKDSALMSFLNYARDNIAAPISIDVYGANGWYRSGLFTGQDVETLKNYIDAISPMYYPSHFEQSFLNYKPQELRPYRIYKFGAFRTFFISKYSIVVRPFVQAFKIGVSYDLKFYGPGYVWYEIKGTEDSIDHGYLFWNAAGKYQDLLKVYSGDFTNKSKSKNK
ncbi:MAG: hypothetical protein A2Y33_15480 [Spirochaetes bacterium GWF1_51_8]|nr:MAG: hypothetical protein A2Y33_15480 [Spirochaetes bacterium GWF1_51_8]